jgi:hypothetical protein
MPKYRFSSLGVDGAVQSSCVMEVESDDEARAIAGELLTENQSDTIEVWDILRLVHRASRETNRSAA